MIVRTRICVLFCLLLVLLLAGCENKEPIQLGFVGGMSGKVADLGSAGRNGVQLAVEQYNAAGGIDGRTVNLVVRDDEQNAETAKRVIGELVGQGIELIIGPMTSSMAMVMMPQLDASDSILLSPTVTTTDLVGKDDHFLRVISTTVDYASKSARYLYEKKGIRSVAAIYDIGNRSYTGSWLRDFRQAFEALGGRMLLEKPFRSTPDTAHLPLAEELLVGHPDCVVIITNSIDSALLCQQLRKLAPGQEISMAEWASTERFVQLAGTAAEGVVVSQFLDRNDDSKRYQQFLADYRQRFKQEPGFAGLAGYDAGVVALEAFAARESGQTLKQVILEKQTFQGGQQRITLDAYGDSDRRTFVTVIRDGQYFTVE